MTANSLHIFTTWLDEYRIEESLTEKLNSLTLIEACPPKTADKWLLSSALQKLIRRGATSLAIAVAIKVHQVDSLYLRSRLPIIAIEDIGMGDLNVCQAVLSFCSSAQWWGPKAHKTIALLIALMATALKSRSACDAFSLTETSTDRHYRLAELLAFDTESLVNLACNIDESQLTRLFVLRILGGITVFDKGTYQTLSSCNLKALDSVAVRLSLPPTVRWLMARQRKTAGMAALLPIAFEAGHNALVHTVREFPRAQDNIGGLPLCTLDMYTKLGRTALKRFYETTKALQDFVSQHVHRHDPQPLINLAMFQIESSLLDQFLSSPKLDDLKDTTDATEMECLGMVDPSNRHELYRLLRENSHFLADIRIDLLNSLFLTQESIRANPPAQLTLNGC